MRAQLPDLCRSMLTFWDQGRVRPVLGSGLPFGFGGGELVGLFEQVEGCDSQNLTGVDHSLFADRRADGGDVLPTVAGGA